MSDTAEIAATGGRPAVTIAQIAQHVSVSEATVSRVLNGKGHGFISTATRTRVLNAAHKLGYHPNRLARGLATGRTQIISLWIRNPDRPYYAGILRSLQREAAADAYEMLLYGFRDSEQDRHSHTTDIWGSTWPVDAVLAADCRRLAESYLARPALRKPPVIGLGSDYPENCDYVAFDEVHGVEMAAEHLVSIGCRRLAHLSGGCSIGRVRRARLATFSRIVTAAGRAPEILHAADESRGEARRTVTEYVQAHGAPDGLFCLNDDMAIGAFRALRDLGLRVPQDVALVGCDGIEDSEYLDPRLTTILQPVDQLCHKAWRILRMRVDSPESPLSQVLIQPTLVVRESTRRD